MARGKVLVLEDEVENLKSLTKALEKVDYVVYPFSDSVKGMAFFDSAKDLDLVLTDLRMPGMDGIAVLKHVKESRAKVPVLLITAFGTIETAVEAMKIGADDYLGKPIDLYELRKRVEAHVEKHRLSLRVNELQARLDERFGFENIVGTSRSMLDLFQQVKMVAPTRATVLIYGESGTGKELIANAIHHNSERKGRRFLPVNCAAIPANLMESELFGHEKGSFTGAIRSHPGKFEQADGGTLFLDEIGELPLELQAKLLRVLEEHAVTRVGSTRPLKVDVRIIAATNKDLGVQVASGEFREDLFYRLKVVELRIPPLRERRGDIPLLAKAFLKELANEHDKEISGFSEEVLSALTAHDWPGNVRELRNVIEHMVVFSRGDTIESVSLPAGFKSAETKDTVPSRGSVPSSPEVHPFNNEEILPLEVLEKRAILDAIEKTGGNRTKAASRLGIGLRTLHRKLKQYNTDLDL